jgi:hypothetical protein
VHQLKLCTGTAASLQKFFDYVTRFCAIRR